MSPPNFASFYAGFIVLIWIALPRALMDDSEKNPDIYFCHHVNFYLDVELGHKHNNSVTIRLDASSRNLPNPQSHDIGSFKCCINLLASILLTKITKRKYWLEIASTKTIESN